MSSLLLTPVFAVILGQNCPVWPPQTSQITRLCGEHSPQPLQIWGDDTLLPFHPELFSRGGGELEPPFPRWREP